MENTKKILLLLCLGVFMVFNCGCSLIDSAEDTEAVIGITAEELSSMLADAESSITDTSDLSLAKTVYQSVLEIEPENPEANTGMAIVVATEGAEDIATEIADISNSFGDLNSTKSTAKITAKAMEKVTINLMAYQVKARNVLFNINSCISHLQIAERSTTLQFQLTKLVLSRINTSIKRITGTDPGIPQALSRYTIDLGDIYLLDSVLNLTKAVLNISTSYNFSQLESRINAGIAIESPDDVPSIPIFSDGANRLSTAKEALILAFDKFLHGAELIFARTDTENRLINPSASDKADYDTKIKPFLLELKASCQSVSLINPPQDPEDTTPTAPFRLAIGNTLSSPKSDLRDYIPAFDVEGEPIKPVIIGGLFPDGLPEDSVQ
ncbi:hypothetical protein KAJ27_14665 [bacterium]|nr:hypothetical protein [bacterium]